MAPGRRVHSVTAMSNSTTLKRLAIGLAGVAAINAIVFSPLGDEGFFAIALLGPIATGIVVGLMRGDTRLAAATWARHRPVLARARLDHQPGGRRVPRRVSPSSWPASSRSAQASPAPPAASSTTPPRHGHSAGYLQRRPQSRSTRRLTAAGASRLVVPVSPCLDRVVPRATAGQTRSRASCLACRSRWSRPLRVLATNAASRCSRRSPTATRDLISSRRLALPFGFGRICPRPRGRPLRTSGAGVSGRRAATLAHHAQIRSAARAAWGLGRRIATVGESRVAFHTERPAPGRRKAQAQGPRPRFDRLRPVRPPGARGA